MVYAVSYCTICHKSHSSRGKRHVDSYKTYEYQLIHTLIAHISTNNDISCDKCLSTQEVPRQELTGIDGNVEVPPNFWNNIVPRGNLNTGHAAVV
jgi:hypothetical protein